MANFPALLLVLVICIGNAAPALALPTNPDNATKSDNCEEARRNLLVALKGSSLISVDENEAILKKAEKNVRDLCS